MHRAQSSPEQSTAAASGLRTRRVRLALGVAVLSAGCAHAGTSSRASSSLTVTVPAASTSTTAAALPAGVEGTREGVPWSQVGAGWILAEWGPDPAVAPGDTLPPGAVPRGKAATTLYLIDPQGGRYPITTFGPGDLSGPGTLDAWSGDGQRALFTNSVGSSTLQTEVTEMDLTTATSHAFTLPGSATVGYTQPSGKAIVVSTAGSRLAATVERVDESGAVQVMFPTTFAQVGSTTGGSLYTPDGASLVLGATGGLALVSNGGQTSRELPVSAANGDCSPLRWWDTSTVLASCSVGTSRLWLVPTTGAPPTALTAPLSGQGPDLGDENAWRLPSGTYLQDEGPCGYQYLARLRGDGTTAPVSVPGVASGDSVSVLGVDGARLALRANLSCGAGESLLWFDPASSAVTPLLGPPINGGGVLDAMLFPAA